MNFILFAIILVALIYVLQGVFMNKYYEQMKSDETRQTALALQEDYKLGTSYFTERARQLSENNGIFIRADFNGTSVIFDSGTSFDPDTSMFFQECLVAREALRNSDSGFISLKTTDPKEPFC